jgi:hypothetical protein
MSYEDILNEVIRLGGNKPSSGVESFIRAAEQLGYPNPLVSGETVIIDEEGEPLAGLKLTSWQDTARIVDIRALSKGGGKKALTTLCDLADHHYAPLSLTAEGYAHVPTAYLIRWYKSHGFEEVNSDGEMRRDPV